MEEVVVNIPLLLGRVEAKVDILLERTQSHESRMRAVENKIWYVSGGFAAVAVLLSAKLRAVFGY